MTYDKVTFMRRTGGLLALLFGASMAIGCGATPVDDEFACGPNTCSTPWEYCFVGVPGIIPDIEEPGDFNSYSCEPLPDTCTEDRSCECLLGETGVGFPVAGDCQATPEGGLRLTIYYP